MSFESLKQMTAYNAQDREPNVPEPNIPATPTELEIDSLCAIIRGAYGNTVNVEQTGDNSIRVDFKNVVWEVTITAYEKKTSNVEISLK